MTALRNCNHIQLCSLRQNTKRLQQEVKQLQKRGAQPERSKSPVRVA